MAGTDGVRVVASSTADQARGTGFFSDAAGEREECSASMPVRNCVKVWANTREMCIWESPTSAAI
jgi:hypothetical protein